MIIIIKIKSQEMEDFLVLSILDLQLDVKQHSAVNKNDIIAYVMLGDMCIDCLVLGSPNSSVQKQGPNQQHDAGGAANPNLRHPGNDMEERGSSHWEHEERQQEQKQSQHPVGHFHKKTKVPLVGLAKDGKAAPKALQVVLKKIGTEKERFGSVSFSLKRFTKNPGQSFLHWVTLYDSLDDDLFEGDLGVDDDFDYPRVLLDYQVVSSQFTSMINKAEQIKLEAGTAAEKQKRLQDNRIDPRLEEKSGKGRAKAVRLTNLSQTVEFFETRADKVSGKRQGFDGHVMSD